MGGSRVLLNSSHHQEKSYGGSRVLLNSSHHQEKSYGGSRVLLNSSHHQEKSYGGSRVSSCFCLFVLLFLNIIVEQWRTTSSQSSIKSNSKFLG